MKPLRFSKRQAPSDTRVLDTGALVRLLDTPIEGPLGLPIKSIVTHVFGSLSPETWVNSFYERVLDKGHIEAPSRSLIAFEFLMSKWELAGKPMRKMRPEEPIYVHSGRVTKHTVAVMRHITNDQATLEQGIEKALTHDVPEDMSDSFGPAVQEIAERFGQDVGYSVQLMSTPHLHRLVRKYLDLVCDDELPILHDGSLDLTSKDTETKRHVKATIKAAIDQLKASQPEVYERMKSRVTLQYKRDSAQLFSLDTAIIKDTDGTDSLRCHVEDIKAGREKIVAGRSFVSHKSYDGKKPSEITLDRLTRMIEERREMHGIYMERIRDHKAIITDNYARSPRPLWKVFTEPRQYKVSGFDDALNQLDVDFYQAMGDLSMLMQSARLQGANANDNRVAIEPTILNPSRSEGAVTLHNPTASKPAPGSAAA